MADVSKRSLKSNERAHFGLLEQNVPARTNSLLFPTLQNCVVDNMSPQKLYSQLAEVEVSLRSSFSTVPSPSPSIHCFLPLSIIQYWKEEQTWAHCLHCTCCPSVCKWRVQRRCICTLEILQHFHNHNHNHDTQDTVFPTYSTPDGVVVSSFLSW